jgi:hypothetical protein
MMKLSLLTIKRIASGAVFMPAIGLFSSQVSAQTTSEPLVKRIEASSQRVAPLRTKAKDTQQRYAVEKAQCWLDFSKHEALRNNPTQVPELALDKAIQLLSGLETGAALSSTALDSVLSAQEGRMRNDLWTQLEAIKSSKQMSCAVKEIACTEVMLVQAAHAHARIDWRYAQPYFGMAEDGLRSAKSKAASCPTQP